METPTRQRGPMVLLAEDDDSYRTMATILLDQAGLRVTAARDGAEAIAILEEAARQKVSFDLLLLDLRMPFATGWEVLKRSREVAPLGTYPPRALLMTGFTMELDLDKVRKEGASGILIKPIPNAVLLYEVGRILSVPKQSPVMHGQGSTER